MRKSELIYSVARRLEDRDKVARGEELSNTFAMLGDDALCCSNMVAVGHQRDLAGNLWSRLEYL